MGQLQNVSSELSSDFTLCHNIDGGNAAFAPIGGDTEAFKGVFNGGNHIIRGLYISGDSYNTGLFGSTENAVISNIRLFESYCNGAAGGSVGSIVGYGKGGSISNCFGGLTVNTAGYGGVTFGGILGGGSSSVSDCIGLGRMLSGGFGFGDRFYAISGGSGPVNNCYALDILSRDAIDVKMGYGVVTLDWDEMRGRLTDIPSDYPRGAVYWIEQENVITNKVGEVNYIGLRASGDISDWIVRLESLSGQEVSGVIVNVFNGVAVITLTPEYIEVAGEYRLIAFTYDGAYSDCRFVIIPDIGG